MERRAEEAEREAIKLKKVEYMQERIGEVFTGVISGITKWGAYVELPNTVEGLVHVTNMRDDHYEYIEDRYELIGERTHNIYKLGQPVKVELMGVDKLQRTIDFLFADEDAIPGEKNPDRMHREVRTFRPENSRKKSEKQRPGREADKNKKKYGKNSAKKKGGKRGLRDGKDRRKANRQQ